MIPLRLTNKGTVQIPKDRNLVSGARSAGVKFGRKLKPSPYQRAEAIKRRGAAEMLAAIAKSYDVSLSMISGL
jgi:hypothetical protein